MLRNIDIAYHCHIWTPSFLAIHASVAAGFRNEVRRGHRSPSLESGRRASAKSLAARFTEYLTTVLRLSYDNAISHDRLTTDF